MEAGEILLRRGLLNDQQLNQSRETQGNGSSVVDRAVELGYVSEEQALRALGSEVGIDYIDLNDAEIDYALVEIVRRALPEYEAGIIAEDFGSRVTFRIEVPEEHIDALTKTVAGLSSGTASIRETESDTTGL